jgi:hypothetical protein
MTAPLGLDEREPAITLEPAKSGSEISSMSRFSPDSSVATRVDASVMARNLTETRYGARRFFIISWPQAYSLKASRVITPSADGWRT